ncbi:MAG: hypothetical protein ACRD3Q_06375, partial [Terriglobales bacterium]
MRRKWVSLSRIALFVAIGSFVSFYSSNLNAQNLQGYNFVYVMSNASPNNSIMQYLRGNDGSLSFVSEVLSGGSGTGATGVDPLGSQDSLVLSGDGHLLL